MPRKSSIAVAEKPARKTRVKATPAPTMESVTWGQGDFVRGKNDPSLHGFIASVGRTWLKLQGDKNCKIDEVELVCRLPEQLSDHFKLAGLSREEKLDNLLESYGFYNLSSWRVAKSDDDSTHFRFYRDKQWEIQFFRSTEVDLLSDGHTWYLALDKHPELKSNGDIEKYCVEAIDHAEGVIAQVKEYEDAALAALIEPAQFHVGDRVYYVQETNTGVVQDLREGEALVKLTLAASKPVWLGLGQLHLYTVNHVVDVITLAEGSLVKGQTLQGDEYQGKFTGASMSGMVMLEAFDGKKRKLNPATLVRIEEKPSEVKRDEGESTPPKGDDTPPPPTYTPGFLTLDEASALFDWSQGLDWQQNSMRMYGKETKLPRLEIMFGDEGCNYRYGSVTLKPQPWPAELQALREKVEATTGFKYQVVIGNLYQDGSHHIGWHSDDSPEMGEDPAIASISLGATRKFDIRNEATKEIQSYELSAGDLVFMPSGLQSTHKHRIAKTSKQVGTRINWTFRPYPQSEAQTVIESKEGDRPYPNPQDQVLGDGEIKKEEFTVTLANGWEVKVEVEDWDLDETGGDYGFSFSGPVSPTGYRHEFSKKVDDIRQHAQELAQRLFDEELPKDADGTPIFGGDTCIVLKGKNKGFEGEINGNVFEGKMSFKPDYKISATPSNLRRLKQGAKSIEAIGDLSVQEKEKIINAPATSIKPKEGDRLDGLSVTGNYHSGVFVERTTSGLFLIQREDGERVAITPKSARVLEQQELPIEQELPTELPLSQLRLDGGTQPRAALDQDHVSELFSALTAGEKLPPVVAFYDGTSYWLADGFHRLEAHSRAAKSTIPVEVKQGTQRDAILYAVGTNAAHGLKRSAADKRRAVLRLLEDQEWSQWSDREIARLTKTSHPFVAKIRQEMPTNLVTFPDRRKFQRGGETHEMAVPAQPRPKDPIPTVEELHIMFSQIGTVKPLAKGTGFAVENPIGAPFPLAFKNRIQAWDWWQNHTEQIARLITGAPDYKPPLDPHPQTEITEETKADLAAAGLQICRPSITPEEFNREMEKPLPLPNNGGGIPKGVARLTEIPGGWRVDGLELPTEVYQKLAAISRRHTKDASLKEAIAYLVETFEMQEGA